MAPLVFNSVLEYPLMLAAACLLRPPPRSSRYERLWRWSDTVLMLLQGCVFAFAACALWQGRLAKMAEDWSSKPLKTFALAITDPTAKIWWIVAAGVLAFLLQRRRVHFAVAVATLLGVCLMCGEREGVLRSARSFFGVLRVETGHYNRGGDRLVFHTLMHGSTMHGEQSRDPNDALDPWTYYHRSGPVGKVFNALEHRAAFLRRGHISVVGLGTGSVAAYAQAGQALTYFEIDAAVRRIAQNPKYFTYLTDCRVEPRICMGDARLTLAREPDGQFDVLLIDAFSSDAIPVHLITYEAVKMYFHKLAPHGLLMVHLSNRHLRLEPVVAGEAAELGVVARVRTDEDEAPLGKSSSTWAVLARTPEDLGRLKDDEKWKPLEPEARVPLWTDDYSSIVSVMNWDWDWLPKLPKWMRRAKAAE